VVSNGLYLPATNTFSPITTLITTLHLDQSYYIFLNYQFTVWSLNQDFYSKLIVNEANARSLVYTGLHAHKNPTGLWMTNLNTGTMEITIILLFYFILVILQLPITIFQYLSIL